MKNIRYIPITLIAVAILSGCNTMQKNPALTEAHSSYNSALTNPQVANLAELELHEAGESLNKADSAQSKGESTDTVNHLAYIARQKVRVAQETANRKTAELAVANARAERDKIRLDARTSEADAAKQQMAIVQGTANEQAIALAAAGVNAERDKALIAQQEMQLQELNAQQEMQLKELNALKLNAQKTNRGLVITLGDVLFSSGKAQLKSGGTRNLQKLADFLKEYPKHKILIEGYTDSTGSESFNQSLSERRAIAVHTALNNMGISKDRISTIGYGEAFPVAGNDTAASRQLNRRVEIIISDDKGNIAPR